MSVNKSKNPQTQSTTNRAVTLQETEGVTIAGLDNSSVNIMDGGAFEFAKEAMEGSNVLSSQVLDGIFSVADRVFTTSSQNTSQALNATTAATSLVEKAYAEARQPDALNSQALLIGAAVVVALVYFASK